MFRIVTSIIFIALVSVIAGCSMCCGPHDYDYPVFNGKFQRADATRGRVGSRFSDPFFSGFGPSADSNLEEPESFLPIQNDLEDGGEDLEDPDAPDDLDEIRRRIQERDGVDVDDLIDPDERPQPDTRTSPEDGTAFQRAPVGRRAWR